jgi:hypothetical protein
VETSRLRRQPFHWAKGLKKKHVLAKLLEEQGIKGDTYIATAQLTEMYLHFVEKRLTDEIN